MQMAVGRLSDVYVDYTILCRSIRDPESWTTVRCGMWAAKRLKVTGEFTGAVCTLQSEVRINQNQNKSESESRTASQRTELLWGGFAACRFNFQTNHKSPMHFDCHGQAPGFD